MTAQPDLFPSAYMDSPALIYRRGQQRLYEFFKQQHGIYTHHNKDCEEPWSALATWKARRSLEGARFISDPVELIAEFAWALDDNELMMYGQTEIEVVRNLAKRHNMNGETRIDWEALMQ